MNEYIDSIEDKVNNYKQKLAKYAECLAAENFSKLETIKARTELNIAEEDLRALRLDLNDLAIAKTNSQNI